MTVARVVVARANVPEVAKSQLGVLRERRSSRRGRTSPRRCISVSIGNPLPRSGKLMGLKWRATPAACNSAVVRRIGTAITMSRGSKNGNVIARCEMYTENDRARGERLTSVNSVRKEPSGNATADATVRGLYNCRVSAECGSRLACACFSLLERTDARNGAELRAKPEKGAGGKPDVCPQPATKGIPALQHAQIRRVHQSSSTSHSSLT